MSKQEYYTDIKAWPFSRRSRSLIINHDILKYDSGNFLNNTATVFIKDEVKEFRCGIKWIRGYEFYIGREYQIFIRNKNNEEIAIYFKTLYGYRKKQLHEQYGKIIQALWDFFFWDIVTYYFKEFSKGKEFELSNVHFSKQGLTIELTGVLNLKKKLIPWDKVGTHDYATYFAIFAMDDSVNINRGYSYLKDWNTYVLNNVVREILKHKKDPAKNN